jgi:hypothetical protein
MERVSAAVANPTMGALPGGAGGRKSAPARAVLLTLVIAAALAANAASASAVVVRLAGGKTVSYQPLRGSQPSLQGVSPLNAAPFAGLVYHGGPVMTSNTNYTFYWAPGGSPAYAAGYQAGINRYFEDLAHDSGGNQNVDSVAAQYTNASSEPVSYNSHFAGAILDTDPYPANGCKAAAICLTDAQLKAEIKAYVLAHGLPADLAHEYFLLTPPGVESCFAASGQECSAGSSRPAFCAYHGFITTSGGVIVFANDPYVVGNLGCDSSEHPNNSPSDGALQGGLSHEHNESITDPELNAWYATNGEENGDKCRTFTLTSEFGTPLGTAADGSRYNQIVNGDLYWYQQEWSNEGGTCRQRLGGLPPVPVLKKLAPKTGPAAGGTAVTITGSGFTTATAVSFGATPAASFKVNSDTSITAVSPAGVSQTVDVRVSTFGGTSAIVTADHYKYGPPTVTAVSPASGPKAGGTIVTISGSGFALGAGTTVTFGTVAATAVNCASLSSCTATAPARTKVGAVDVRLAVGTLKSAKSAPADQFTYL